MKKEMCVRLARCLIVVLLVTAMMPMQPKRVQAATTISMTMYVGEDGNVIVDMFTDENKVKSIKSSNSKVVKASKNRDGGSIFVWARKKGTATVTVQTKSKTIKYKITVVPLDFQASLSVKADSGRYSVKVKNNSKIPITDFRVSCTIAYRRSDGEMVYDAYPHIFTESGKVLFQNETMTEVVDLSDYCEKNEYTLVPEECSVQEVMADRKLDCIYKDLSSNVKFKVRSAEVEKSYLNVEYDLKNPLKKEQRYNYLTGKGAYTEGYLECRLYNRKDQLLGIQYLSADFTKSNLNNKKENVYPIVRIPLKDIYWNGYHHYKIIPHVYQYKYLYQYVND